MPLLFFEVTRVTRPTRQWARTIVVLALASGFPTTRGTPQLTDPPKPATPIGVRLRIVVPSPSSPPSFKPQHMTAPALVSAQTWPSSTVIAVTPLERPETSTGVWRSVRVPSPSSPSTPLYPQHLTPPALVNAHVTPVPAAIAVTP